MLIRDCPLCQQQKSLPNLLDHCFNCWYASSPREKQTALHNLLTKINQDPDQALNWLYADAHSGQFIDHPEQTWEQLNQQLTNLEQLIQQRKTTSQQEITLIKEILDHA